MILLSSVVIALVLGMIGIVCCMVAKGMRAFKETLSHLADGALCGVRFLALGIAQQILLRAFVWLNYRAVRRHDSTRTGMRENGSDYQSSRNGLSADLRNLRAEESACGIKPKTREGIRENGSDHQFHRNSLNADPYNLRAEELALEDCSLGVEIRRIWAETEMVRSFNGGHIPGTPDGMFESWDGALTCVQVVRVPLVRELDADGMYEVLAQTIITKVVKSQQWLQATSVTLGDFIIFCWLPFAVSDAVAVRAHTLMEEVRTMDPRFSLRMRVPAEANSLFPTLFASNHDLLVQRRRGHSWCEVTTYCGSDDTSDREADIVWGDMWASDEEGEED